MLMGASNDAPPPIERMVHQNQQAKYDDNKQMNLSEAHWRHK